MSVDWIGLSISLACFAIVLAVSIVNLVLVVKNKKNIEALSKRLDEKTNAILDHDEFKNLDPTLKELYRKHIVGTLLPAIVDAVNSASKKVDLDGYVKENPAEIDSAVAAIAERIRRGGFVAPTPTPTPTRTGPYCCQNMDTGALTRSCREKCAGSIAVETCASLKQAECAARKYTCTWSDAGGCKDPPTGPLHPMTTVAMSRCEADESVGAC